MAMLPVLLGIGQKCPACGQQSDPRAGKGKWEVIGIWNGAINRCTRCGALIRIGFVSDEVLSNEEKQKFLGQQLREHKAGLNNKEDESNDPKRTEAEKYRERMRAIFDKSEGNIRDENRQDVRAWGSQLKGDEKRKERKLSIFDENARQARLREAEEYRDRMRRILGHEAAAGHTASLHKAQAPLSDLTQKKNLGGGNMFGAVTDAGVGNSAPSRNGYAICGLILGIVGVFFFFIGIIPILAIVFSGIGLAKVRDRQGKGKVQACIGLILGILYTLVYLYRYGHI